MIAFMASVFGYAGVHADQPGSIVMIGISPFNHLF